MEVRPLIGKVTDKVWISSALQWKTIQRLGVRSVVNVSGIKFPGRRYLFQLIDGVGNSPNKLVEIVSCIDALVHCGCLRCRNAGKVVLVHCYAGRSRSVVCAALWMAWRGWPGNTQSGPGALDEALACIAKCYRRSAPNPRLVATAREALRLLRSE